MQKKIFERINLTCVFQNTNNFGNGNASSNQVVVSGMLSPDKDGNILFQEAIPRRRDIRNNRLYEGTLLNVVRRKDGCYYPFMKSFKPEDIKDKGAFAFRIYSELTEALNSID